MDSVTIHAATPGLRRSTDVLVVGAGIVGLAHAVAATRRGMEALVIDRDHRATGASVRNFGHCCITAQTGVEYELAMAGRSRWLDLAHAAGFWAAECGAVVVARSQTELAVLHELSSAREPGQVQMLSPAEVAARLGRSEGPSLVGGAWLRDDLRVDPRTTVAAISQWLDRQAQASVTWNTTAFGYALGTTRRVSVATSRGTIEADHVIFCVGHDVDQLFPDVAANHHLTRCTLQMARASSPGGRVIDSAVLTGTSMLRYPAFAQTDSAVALRDEIDPRLLDVAANVMFTQRPDGSLIVGDSHAWDVSAEPWLDAATSSVLEQTIAGVLDVPGLDILERWQGVYASSDRGTLLQRTLDDGVQVISVTSGIGMTISFGLGERTISALSA